MPAFERPSAISPSTSSSRGVSSESGPSSPRRGDELGDDLGVERRASLRDARDRLDELVHVHDPILQQVADAAAAVAEQLRGVGRLDVLGDDQDRRLRGRAAQLERRAQALVAVVRRQPDVDDRHVRALGADRSISATASPTAATTSKPLSRSSRCSPSRSSARSSAITTRKAAPRGSSSARPPG